MPGDNASNKKATIQFVNGKFFGKQPIDNSDTHHIARAAGVDYIVGVNSTAPDSQRPVMNLQT
ncbi:hypothetical protein HGG75_08960 [Ochrobactrum pseudogrignonense]|nr:hypothetical protein [Brucella pseudogrignonensis]